MAETSVSYFVLLLKEWSKNALETISLE